MASSSRTWIVAAVTLLGLGLVAGAAALLTAEGQRFRARDSAPVAQDGEACDHGTWALVVRDGERTVCLSAADLQDLAARGAPFEYECQASAPQVEPPPSEIDPAAVPLDSAAIRYHREETADRAPVAQLDRAAAF